MGDRDFRTGTKKGTVTNRGFGVQDFGVTFGSEALNPEPATQRDLKTCAHGAKKLQRKTLTPIPPSPTPSP